MDDPRLDAMILAIGRQSACLSREQRKAFALLLHLSRTVEFVDTGDSKYVDGSRRITVEVDGGRQVDVDFDGTLELLDEPRGFATGGRVEPIHVHLHGCVAPSSRHFTDEQLDEICREVSKRIARRAAAIEIPIRPA